MLTTAETARIVILMSFGFLFFVVPGFIAWRNIARGKADRRGATRLAVAIFCANMLLWIFRGHFVAALGQFGLFVLALSSSLFSATVIWTVYLALEPYVRRHWPQTIISWSRLLTGQVRDPAVGRDVLLGVTMGTLWTLMFALRNLLTRFVGAEPDFSNTDYMRGARSALGAWLVQIPGSVRATLMFFFFLFILRALLRNKWLAATVFVAIWTLVQTLGADHPLIEVPIEMALYVIAAVALVRFGLVTLAAAVFTADTLGNVPMTLNPSMWYFSSTVFVVAAVVLLAAWAFHAATAGRKLFATDLFE